MFTSAAATALEQSHGYFVATSASGAQVRVPGASDMNISKHAVNRLVEFIVLGSFRLFHFFVGTRSSDSLSGTKEYPSIRAFSLAPGIVQTRLLIEAKGGDPLDTVALPAATTLYLTSGRADWLSGRSVEYSLPVFELRSCIDRYCSANWDMGEVERDWKDAILEQKALVNKLCVPGARL